MKKENAKPNQLAVESSPYLQQHAYNPVNWYPWSPTALALARKENKPILLSIGYAACHWCHVMAHESFEDPATAELMNELFINIKVDREERPDLDKIYQSTHYLLTQRSGGWPLTVFLAPDDLTPFFSGTYFPKEPKHHLPPFKFVLQKVADIFANQKNDIAIQNQSLRDALQKTINSAPDIPQWTAEPLNGAIKALEDRYDNLHGGFEKAPKFPHTTVLQFLLHEKSPMALHTLLCMAEGGIYDQLRGGFYRYSVDNKWEIPHFEKMLYDNGKLLFLYSIASQIYDEPFFAEVARETAEWVLAEMQSPEGGYYSSLDADSQGEEGSFYVWKLADVESLLTREELEIVKVYYGLNDPANFENQWHFHITEALQNAHEKKVLKSARKKLLTARNKRPHPHRDEKILTSWNALMIKGMLVAGVVLEEPRFIESAQKALAFIEKNLWIDGELRASFKDGKNHLVAYLDDYAFLLDAVIASHKIEKNNNDLPFAKKIANKMIELFYDKIAGGFFFTATTHEKILYRPKTFMDEAMPSGNGVAVDALFNLDRLSPDARYIEAANKTLAQAWPLILQYPAEHCSMLLALRDKLGSL